MPRPASFSWSVDTTAPTVTIDSLSKRCWERGRRAKSAGTPTRTAPSACGSAAPTATRARSSTPAPTAPSPPAEVSDVDAADLAEGANTLRLCLIDAAGNRGQASDDDHQGHHRPAHPDRHPSGLARQRRHRQIHLLGQLTPAARASPPSNAGATPASLGRLHLAAANSAASPRAPTPSKSERSTTPATPTQSPAAFTWTVDTTAPDTQIDIQPAALANSATADFTFSGSDPGGSGVASFQCRLDSGQPALRPLHLAAANCSGLSRRLPQIRSAGDRQRRQRRAAPGLLRLDRRHHRAAAPRSTPTRRPGQRRHRPLHLLGIRRRRLGRRLLRMPPRLEPAGDWAACTSPQELQRPRRRLPQLRSPRDRQRRQRRCRAGLLRLDASTPPRPQTQIDTHPAAIAPSNDGQLHLLGLRRRRLGRRLLRMPPRLRQTGRPAPRREATPRSPRAPTPSKCGRSTTAGNADQSPACFNWSVDTTAPQTQIDTHPAALANAAAANFTFSGDRPRRLGRRLLRMPPRRRPAWRLAHCTSPRELQRPRRGLPQLRSQSDRQRRQRRCHPAALHLDAWTPTAPATQIDTQPAEPRQRRRRPLHLLGVRRRRLGRRLLPMPPRLRQLATGRCSSPQDFSGLADGPHSFEVRAIDNAGNADAAPASFSWTVDTTAPRDRDRHPPDRRSPTPPPPTSPSRAPTRRLGRRLLPVPPGLQPDRRLGTLHLAARISRLADGAHKFEVRAIDRAGNIDQSPAAFDWTVDTAAPRPRVDRGSIPASGRRTALSWSGRDPARTCASAPAQCRARRSRP